MNNTKVKHCESKRPAVMSPLAAEAQRQSLSKASAHRVLVIDDDEFICRALESQLRAAGISDLTITSNGPEAVRLLNESKMYTLIISDLSIPKVDGIQLLRLISVRQTEAAVVLISASGRRLLASAEDLARTRGLRVLGALEKPIRADDLQRMLSTFEEAARPSAKPAGPLPSAAELRTAIEGDEIQVYVQPQLEAHNGALHGVEALARWYSPSRGVVPPANFVPLAEETGLIDELTELMLRRSVAVCGNWNRAGLKTNISVNVPITSMCRLNLPDTILMLAERHGLEARQITLEITEGGFMQDPVRSLDVLTRLRLRGIGLAIDDFGCGYSSLQQLKRMPFNELKIDCSFVMAMFKDRESYSIVKSNLDLGHELGLRTVAEGVETREHWDALRELGCDLVQGYHIARPFPAAQLTLWARDHLK